MARMTLQTATNTLRSIWQTAQSNPMPTIAFIAALASMAVVHPDSAYLGYFDWHTLLCLWAMLATLNALRGIGLFRRGAQRLVERFSSARSVVLGLSLITFVGSAFLTNDLALITFLPLSISVLVSAKQEQLIPFTLTMQTLAANLGGMILPFGNPQNLFLFSYYHLGLGEFMHALAVPFAASLALILICCLFVKPDPLTVTCKPAKPYDRGRLTLYLALFASVILGILNLVPYWAACGAAIAVLLIADPKSVSHVDYGLLFTFACFFVFSGNLTRIPAVQELLTGMVQNRGAFIVGVISSQVVSNVPSAILLAPFTSDWEGLLLGVDIGGVGTPIASLASLITLSAYSRCQLGNTTRFVLLFEAFSFGFLAILATLVLML